MFHTPAHKVTAATQLPIGHSLHPVLRDAIAPLLARQRSAAELLHDRLIDELRQLYRTQTEALEAADDDAAREQLEVLHERAERAVEARVLREQTERGATSIAAVRSWRNARLSALVREGLVDVDAMTRRAERAFGC